MAWALENGIINGLADGTFGVNNTCTRGQSVTFLYRAMGTAPTTVNGFTDVAADSFCADAVAWAVENGVTNGTSATTFSPNNGYRLQPRRALHPGADRHLPVSRLSGQIRGISLYNAKRGHRKLSGGLMLCS